MSLSLFQRQTFELRTEAEAFARCNFKQSYKSSHYSLQTTLSLVDFSDTFSTIESKAMKTKYCISFKLDKNFNALKQKYGIPQLKFLNDDDIIFNYSHRLYRG